MGQNFLSCDREQVMLLPANLADWLPEGHLARFVIGVVERLDLGGMYACYRVDGRGRAAHDPRMMVALVLYNYAVGVRSSRAIERRCVEDVACRVIAANRAPDHVTIARFRARFQAELSELFFEVLALCEQAGMVSVGVVAVDSTKLAANASVDRNVGYGALREQARRVLGEAAETDAREDELYGERRGDELPAELAEAIGRPERIDALLERVRERRGQLEGEREQKLAGGKSRPGGPGPDPKPGMVARQLDRLYATKFNVTDPDSGVVRHRGMRMQGYNVQMAVGDGQVILATGVSRVSPDQGQLATTIQRARSNLERVGIQEPIRQVLADSGYWQLKQVGELQDQGVEVLIPPIRRTKNLERAHPLVREMTERLATEHGRRDYRRRQQIVEPVFAHIKHVRGITRVLRRGKHAVQAEIDLIATTHNLLKLYRHQIA